MGSGCAARSAFGRRAGRREVPTGSEAERSGAKWRGRGLGQRNANLFFLVQDLVLDNYFCSLMGCEYVKKV